VTPATPTYGSFYDPFAGRIRPPISYQIWSGLLIIRSKVIKAVQNLAIGSRDPNHAHLWVVLWSIRMEDQSSNSVPNSNRIAVFVQKLLAGCKIPNWSRDPGHAHLGVTGAPSGWRKRGRFQMVSVHNLIHLHNVRGWDCRPLPLETGTQSITYD